MKSLAFTKTYENGFRLTAPALELQAGEITAVIGANGSGKTTLARVLAGLDRADGAIDPLPGAHPGYLPQKPFAFRMRVEQNILLGGRDRARFAALTEALGLTALLPRRAKRLSGGETAKLALARLLMGDHKLLILDEPTAAMDEESTLAAEALLLRRCREEQSAILLITHSLSQARRISDKALFFKDGALLEQGAAAETLHTPKTEELRRFLAFYGE